MLKEKPDYALDLRGVKCPLNFVKAKLQMDKMNDGSVLELLLDEGEPIKNVSESILMEGHKILAKQTISNYYKILVKKY